jgi:gamma-D-glutamyl-L-lysine dipeptidyl-peptidase
MEFGIILLSVVPVRAEPDDRAEMINQLLFGELIVSTERYQNWIKVRSVFDQYKGWIDKKQIQIIDENEFTRLNNSPVFYTNDLVNIVQNTQHLSFPILLGSSLPGFDNQKTLINGETFEYTGLVSEIMVSREKLVETALLYYNCPYLWGGRSPFGIDCSGLTQMAYKINGVSIARDSAEQAKQGEVINFLSEAKTGDLVFFDNDEEEIIHVGMFLGEDKIIHASGNVRLDKIDHQGIFNMQTQKYTHKLRLIKALI